MTCPSIFLVEIHSVCRPNLSHKGCDSIVNDLFEQEMVMIGHQAVRAYRDDLRAAFFREYFLETRFFIMKKLHRVRAIREIQQHQESVRIRFVFEDISLIDTPIVAVVPLAELK